MKTFPPDAGAIFHVCLIKFTKLSRLLEIRDKALLLLSSVLQEKHIHKSDSIRKKSQRIEVALLLQLGSEVESHNSELYQFQLPLKLQRLEKDACDLLAAN